MIEGEAPVERVDVGDGVGEGDGVWEGVGVTVGVSVAGGVRVGAVEGDCEWDGRAVAEAVGTGRLGAPEREAPPEGDHEALSPATEAKGDCDGEGEATCVGVGAGDGDTDEQGEALREGATETLPVPERAPLRETLGDGDGSGERDCVGEALTLREARALPLGGGEAVPGAALGLRTTLPEGGELAEATLAERTADCVAQPLTL